MLRLILIAALAFQVHSNVFAEDGDLDTLHIPSGVKKMYVFTQQPTKQPGDEPRPGTSTEIKKHYVTPQKFRDDLSEYQKEACSKKANLVVTADAKPETKNGEWVQTEIEYKSQNLQTILYYHPGKHEVYEGADFPLDCKDE